MKKPFLKNTTLKIAASDKQMSESFLLSSILALSGGFQDAYTYNNRDGVFSNAQTGNIVLMSQHIMSGEWVQSFHYLIPLLAFVAGIFLAETLHYKFLNAKTLHWRKIIILIEMVTLFIVGFLPTQYNIIATMLVSFACAMQVQSFRKVRGYPYASTMCIGNLRSGTEALSLYAREHKKDQLRRALHYYGIIIVFAIGAGVGGILTVHFGMHIIWVTDALLFLAFFLM